MADRGTLGDVSVTVAGRVLLLCQYMLAVVWCVESSYLGLEDVALLKDLLDDLFLLVSTELVVELAVGGSVKDTGGALPDGMLALVGYGGVACHVDTYLWLTRIFQPLTT